MKKSKVIIAIVLAVVFVMLCVSVPTFSWFTRPQSQTGEKMMLESKGNYTGYSGKSVTIATYPSDNGFDYSTSSTTSYGGSGISPHNRKYFRTTITNSSGSVQDVSLYANSLSIPTSNNGTLALGVNGPTRSYRDYSELATLQTYSDRDSMRIYFQKPKNNTPTGWTGTEFYICWGDNLNSTGSNGTYYHMTYCGESSGYYNYYSDIPMSATQAFFACENWGTNGSDGHENWAQRTPTLTNLYSDGQSQLQSVVYQLSNTVSNGNTQIGSHFNVNGACINHYYNNIFVAVGNTYDASLGNTTNIPTRNGYSANHIGTLKYYSGNTSVFTVNENTGVITAVGAGDAKLYTKAVGGSYSDEQQVETNVTVTADANYVFYDVPIVRNVLIPSDGSVDVNWYVINNSDTTSLSYSIDSLYLGM